MPNSAIKASPTVSAHAILARRRRRHDIILIAPFALSPSNFVISSPPSNGGRCDLRVKGRPRTRSPGRQAKPRARHTSCVERRHCLRDNRGVN